MALYRCSELKPLNCMIAMQMKGAVVRTLDSCLRSRGFCLRPLTFTYRSWANDNRSQTLFFCYQTVQFGISQRAVMLCSWEGNRRSLMMALAMHHRRYGLTQTQGLVANLNPSCNPNHKLTKLNELFSHSLHNLSILQILLTHEFLSYSVTKQRNEQRNKRW